MARIADKAGDRMAEQSNKAEGRLPDGEKQLKLLPQSQRLGRFPAELSSE
jgi:hypothetical protein